VHRRPELGHVDSPVAALMQGNFIIDLNEDGRVEGVLASGFSIRWIDYVVSLKPLKCANFSNNRILIYCRFKNRLPFNI